MSLPSAMTAQSVMKTHIFTIPADRHPAEAIQLMIEHRISGVPVVDAEGNLEGIITEKDVLRLLYEPEGAITQVRDLMTAPVRGFQMDDPLENVCDCLMANTFRRVPILKGTRLVGLISRADLMPAIMEVAREQLDKASPRGE